MKIWNDENTNGYSKERLEFHNDNFKSWCEENNLDANDKNAQQQYFNEVMIHG